MTSPESQSLANEVYDCFWKQFESHLTTLRQTSPRLADRMKHMGYSIFYNDPRATLTRGEYYLLGLNPGGCFCSENAYPTSDECVAYWEKEERKRYHIHSSYMPETVDETWPSPLQANVRRLLSRLHGSDENPDAVRKTFAANLFFCRTPSGCAEKWFKEYRDALRSEPSSVDPINCWEFHKKCLVQVAPRVILSYGNGTGFSTYSLLKERLPVQREEEPDPVCWRKNVKGFRSALPYREGSIAVIGIPHLSWIRSQSVVDQISEKCLKAIRELLAN